MSARERACPKCGAHYGADVLFCPKDGMPLGGRKTEVVDDPYLGREVAGQFRLDKLIGIGAMGRVYRAHQRGIERNVAVKILHRELLSNETLIMRFHREAKVASRLVHPNVVQVLMTGRMDPEDPDSETYMVMEYLDGISLQSALGAAGGALPLPQALHIMLQVCDAVGEAHAQGIVHRDLKPENVMLVRRGDDHDFAKVLDFGVARIEWEEKAIATQAGAIFGTARYISPEGAQGESVGAAADVYAITTMLFRCLSGTTPFDGENPVSILLKHAQEQAPDVRSIARASYVPAPIAKVIADNLQKKPAERCENARELGRALLDAARDSGLSPDDLILRSTLMGNRALQLPSLQRTKSHGLTPELKAKLAAGGTSIVQGNAQKGPATQVLGDDGNARGGTRAVEATASSTRVLEPEEPEPSSKATLDGAPRSLPAHTTDADAGPATSTEPPSSLPRSSRPSFEPLPPPSSARISHVPGVESPSRLRRTLTIALWFAVGIGLTVLIARQLGVFKSQAPSPAQYAERARAAAQRGNWKGPRDENVRDITDSALQRWPGAPEVLAVRRDAAARLAASARAQAQAAPSAALSLAQLAVEFDPDSTQARQVLAELSGPDPKLTPTPIPSTPLDKKRPRRKRPPATSASSPPEADASPPIIAPPEPSAGGRWL